MNGLARLLYHMAPSTLVHCILYRLYSTTRLLLFFLLRPIGHDRQKPCTVEKLLRKSSCLPQISEQLKNPQVRPQPSSVGTFHLTAVQLDFFFPHKKLHNDIKRSGRGALHSLHCHNLIVQLQISGTEH